MTIEILKHFATDIFLPWIGTAADFVLKGFYSVGKLVIYLPIAIIVGLVILYKREVWKGTHPPR